MDRCRNVQYGCGPGPVAAGWRHFDASPTLRLSRLPVIGGLVTQHEAQFDAAVEYGDIVKGLPVADRSCAAVYSSHTLEHLALEDCRAALRNTFTVCEPGGVFRLVVPDLAARVRVYSESEASDRSTQLMQSTLLGVQSRPRGFSGAVRQFLGNARHLWMWDFEGLAAELESVGFVSIRRATFGDSVEPAFRHVEAKARWDYELGIEAERP